MPRKNPSSSFLASFFTFISAFSLGCVISLGSGDDAGSNECGSLLAHNDANCVCDPGYELCNPNTDDTDCCEKIGHGGGGSCEANSTLVDGQCFCNDGYTWCDPDDPNSLACCEAPGQTSQGTGSGSATEGTSGSTTEEVPTTSNGTTGGPPVCNDAVDPPGSCDPNTENFFCSHPESCGPEGSVFYVCEGGVWVETPNGPNENCMFDGFDFGYGCVDNGTGVDFVCGYGPGTPCNTGEAPSCDGANTYVSCDYGKIGTTDCFKLCTEGDGMGSPTYDFGDCQIQNDAAVCACCDEGDEGCEMGGTSTGTSTGGSTSSSTGG